MEGGKDTTEEVLVTNVEYLIDNVYLSIGNRYRQCVGIFFLLCVVSYCQCQCLLVVRFGHWVCGDSWHAIKGSLSLTHCCPAFVCVCV